MQNAAHKLRNAVSLESAFTNFKTRAAFQFDAAHHHSSLLTPHSSLSSTRTISPNKNEPLIAAHRKAPAVFIFRSQ